MLKACFRYVLHVVVIKANHVFLQQMRRFKRYFSTACNKYVLIEGYFGQSHAMYTYILLVI